MPSQWNTPRSASTPCTVFECAHDTGMTADNVTTTQWNVKNSRYGSASGTSRQLRARMAVVVSAATMVTIDANQNHGEKYA